MIIVEILLYLVFGLLLIWHVFRLMSIISKKQVQKSAENLIQNLNEAEQEASRKVDQNKETIQALDKDSQLLQKHLNKE